MVWIVKDVVVFGSEQKLEEACEHLQMVTHSESLLRSRCASLEKKQQEDKEKMEVTAPGLTQFSGK